MRHARNEREARALMGERYSTRPKLRAGAHYVKRPAGLSRDDRQMLIGRALAIFNFMLWVHLLTAFLGGPK